MFIKEKKSKDIKDNIENKMRKYTLDDDETYKYPKDFVPKLKPKQNEIYITPILIHKYKNDQINDLSIKHNFILSKQLPNLSCPNSENDDEDFSESDNDKKLKYTIPNNNSKNNSINIIKRNLKKYNSVRNYSKEYEDYLIVKKKKMSFDIVENNTKVIWKKYIEKEMFYNNNSLNKIEHKGLILRILESTVKGELYNKKIINNNHHLSKTIIY